MKKKNLIEKLSSGKGFYITAGVSFALIIVAIGFVYSSSVRLIEDLDVPTTIAQQLTEQVQKNKDDVADPRSTTKQTTTKAPETTTKESAVQETTEEIQVSEVFKNESLLYPFGTEISKAFSLTPVYDETMEDWRIHSGVDFRGEKGSDVISVGNGKVTKVVFDTAWGYCIEVDYGSFTARYCGIEQGTAVKIDDVVSSGDLIGKSGDIPCESAQESHLHFEIIRDGKHINPLDVLKGDK